MNRDSIIALDAAELSEAIRLRHVSCREVMAAFLDQIDERNPDLNAIVSRRDRDIVMAEAAERDEELARGTHHGWMHGLPQAIKDLAETNGLTTTFGSPLFRAYVPDHDGLMVARMKASGCVVVGKTNVPEFGKGSHTFNSVFGVTRNPYDNSKSAGGSSGGAAVALATRMLPVADGSDYMGSLRNPAAWNNVFGFRPSQGRVPSHPQADQYVTAQIGTEGPMGRSVVDIALLLGTQAGYDSRVPLSLDGDVPEFGDIATALATLDAGDPVGRRVGWLADLGGHLAMEPGILDACCSGLARLEHLGCVVEPATMPVDMDELWDAWLTWRHMSVAAGIAQKIDDTNRELVKPEVLWEIDCARRLDVGEVIAAAEVRTRYFHEIEKLSDRFDAVVLPSAQVWPFPIEQRWPKRIGDREMDTYHRWMEVTLYASFAGLPAISVPVGFNAAGLPMGMQMIGRPRGDVALLRLAHAYERTIDHLRVGSA